MPSSSAVVSVFHIYLFQFINFIYICVYIHMCVCVSMLLLQMMLLLLGVGCCVVSGFSSDSDTIRVVESQLELTGEVTSTSPCALMPLLIPLCSCRVLVFPLAQEPAYSG